MSDIKHLQHLAGILVEDATALKQHNYTFYIIDPHSGEFTKYYSGSPISIMQQLQGDPENSRLADVLKSFNFSQGAGTDGIVSFNHDDHIFAFIPNTGA